MAEPEVVVCYYEACANISILVFGSWSLAPDRSGRVACWDVVDIPQDSKNSGSVNLTIGKRRRFCA